MFRYQVVNVSLSGSKYFVIRFYMFLYQVLIVSLLGSKCLPNFQLITLLLVELTGIIPFFFNAFMFSGD